MINIKVLHQVNLSILYNEVVNDNVYEFTEIGDFVSDKAYTLRLYDTSKIKKGNLLINDRNKSIYFIDKVYEDRITYKTIFNLFDTEVYCSSNDIGLETLFNDTFINSEDPYSKYKFTMVTNVKAVVEVGVNNMKEVLTNTLFAKNQHLRFALYDEQIYMYFENNDDRFINTLDENAFVSLSLPDISTTYTTCTINIGGTISKYYLLFDNTITDDEFNLNRYLRVKNKYVYLDESDETAEELASAELIDTGDYIAEIVLLNNSHIILENTFLIGDNLTLNKEERELYSGKITGIEDTGTQTTIKVGFDRKEYIFGKDLL